MQTYEIKSKIDRIPSSKAWMNANFPLGQVVRKHLSQTPDVMEKDTCPGPSSENQCKF